MINIIWLMPVITVWSTVGIIFVLGEFPRSAVIMFGALVTLFIGIPFVISAYMYYNPRKEKHNV